MKELNKVEVQDVNGGALMFTAGLIIGFYLGSMSRAH